MQYYSRTLYHCPLKSEVTTLMKNNTLHMMSFVVHILLQLLYEGGNGDTAFGNYLNSTLNCEHNNRRDDLITRPKARGAMDQLIMLLSGPAGCGKSTSVLLAQQYCHSFCMAVAIAFVI